MPKQRARTPNPGIILSKAQKALGYQSITLQHSSFSNVPVGLLKNRNDGMLNSQPPGANTCLGHAEPDSLPLPFRISLLPNYYHKCRILVGDIPDTEDVDVASLEIWR